MVAKALVNSRTTITKGIAKLAEGTKPSSRVRRPRAGRKSVVEVDPGFFDASMPSETSPSIQGRKGDR